MTKAGKAVMPEHKQKAKGLVTSRRICNQLRSLHGLRTSAAGQQEGTCGNGGKSDCLARPPWLTGAPETAFREALGSCVSRALLPGMGVEDGL